MLAGKDGPSPFKVIEDMCWCLDAVTKAAFRAMMERQARRRTAPVIELEADRNRATIEAAPNNPTMVE